jgi:hypothetical protein
MAQTKPQAPYDPVKSVVGMWNGTITRLGYFFKDPEKYGEPTNAVLISTSRRYQDALDDCEIQILEAKWYLEHQLKLNKERREAAQAEKEDSTSAKRKLAEFQEAQKNQEGTTVSQEQPAKRQRIAEDKPNDAGQEKAKQQPQGQKKTQKEIPVGEMKEKSIDLKVEPVELSTGIQTDTTVMQPVQPKEPTAKPPPAPVNTSMPTGSRPSTSYGGRGPPSQSGQNTPTTAAEEPNFESMFGEALADENDAGGLSFDNMDLASTDPMGGTGMEAGSFNDPNAFSLGDTSLNNLLPGLESYAKQSGEHGDGDGGFDFGNAGSADNEFALPDLGTSNFDDFLNDNTFGDGGGGDDFLKDGEMMNLDDLDASFFDLS